MEMSMEVMEMEVKANEILENQIEVEEELTSLLPLNLCMT